jgi:hypothetical protein
VKRSIPTTDNDPKNTKRFLDIGLSEGAFSALLCEKSKRTCPEENTK